ncbi:agmatinase [Conexibacter woesei]|uniref:Agmatinase n=1 Tax=Conexibacter woesei (strain DSM 14684 / CCUG 47730 / CIP 108061 / JCM 11494 / NBRC 100937 / ID131577) TaxID=469383 RepID=D3F8N5_CONWI|nr:agmatinase [Conexibacter woesei]ADB50999.1 agmatinase [Conexibacter woesei DSM 14684]
MFSERKPHYGPPDASLAPRYTGIRTFARCPHATDWANADVAVLGVPFDTATSYRPGARFGPAAIRDQSQLIRPWHAALEVDVFATLSVLDGGDLTVTPGNAARTAEQIHAGLRPVLEAGATPLVLGGDHSIVLGELRAQAERHGPVGVVLLDAHADTWDEYYGERYFHGTPFRRALEEGLIDPRRSLLAGMRGPLYAASDLDTPREWGFEIVTCDELRTLTPAEYGRRVRERIGDGPTFLSFDIDVLDPAFAPGTGTPEIAGLLPHEAVAFLRALAGIRFTGFDVVEVSPQFDGPGQVTALHAASIGFELLALCAVAHAGRA